MISIDDGLTVGCVVVEGVDLVGFAVEVVLGVFLGFVVFA